MYQLPLTIHICHIQVGNLPNDYIMRLKRVPTKDHLVRVSICVLNEQFVYP